MAQDWSCSVTEVFDRAFGDDEAVKCALAANLAYYDDDPDTLWWVFFALAQGGYLGCGGRFIKGGSQRLSSALARAIRSAGGDVQVRRRATAIRLERGRAAAVTHTDRRGDNAIEHIAPVIVGNAAPTAIADMLPEPARAAFSAVNAQRQLSMSVFSATYGLSVPPAELGMRSFANFLLPAWMRRLADHRHSAALLAKAPGDAAPVMTAVNFSAIDSGLGGPPYPVSVVGPDRLDNWAGSIRTPTKPGARPGATRLRRRSIGNFRASPAMWWRRCSTPRTP
jgi:phytoene dehydrogenase-like protein